MRASERLQSEMHFHDLQAQQRSLTFDQNPDLLRFTDEDYLTHETWIRPAIHQLGNLTSCSILDLGCGHGMASILFARRGANVTAVDLSLQYLHEAKRRASVNGVEIQFVQAEGERLPFANHTFDRIWGNAILHHFDLTIAAREIHRLLKPGGWAVFCEPWGGNPILRWARRRLSYAGKGHTPDEDPLQQPDVDLLNRHFTVEMESYQLFSMIQRKWGRGRWLKPLETFDHLLFRFVPLLRSFCRYVVLTLHKNG